MTRCYFLAVLLLVLDSIACKDLKDPPPAAPTPPTLSSATSFNVIGHWEATTIQGRRISFDVNENLTVTNGRINLHHDCNTGRWRVTFDGFYSAIENNQFNAMVNWRTNDGDLFRSGSYSISGTFQSDKVVRGSFANIVTDSRVNERITGEVCPGIDLTYEGEKTL